MLIGNQPHHLCKIPTMANRTIPSSSPLRITNKKPMKRKNKKHKRTTKHSIFTKAVSYLLSDSHMYNPLISPQQLLDHPPPDQIITSPGLQDDVGLKIKGRGEKLMEKVVDFLQADCYLYSPLITDVRVCSEIRAANRESHGGRSANGGGDGGGGGGGVGGGVGGGRRLSGRRVVKTVG